MRDCQLLWLYTWQYFLHFLPGPPRCAKQATVNNMNNAVLLKSPAEARQPAWLRTEPLISLAGRNNTAFVQKQSSSLLCRFAELYLSIYLYIYLYISISIYISLYLSIYL